MKYWHVYYSSGGHNYQLSNSETDTFYLPNTIAVFCNFDMAYQYVTRLNGTNDVQAYSKWAIK